MRAQQRGERRGSSLAEYESVARIGVRHVRETLIARHNVRMVNIHEIPASVTRPVMSALMSFGMMDLALRELGADKNRFPPDPMGGWVDHLAWGADSAFIAARLLLCGQFVGAAVILRSQFERWTENAAFNSGVEHRQGEPVPEYAARAWSACHANYPFAPRVNAEDHAWAETQMDQEWEDESNPSSVEELSVKIGHDYSVRPAELMKVMSDVLHGRDPWISATRWEAAVLREDAPPALSGELAEKLADVLMLNLRQVRVCLATLAEEQGKHGLARILFLLPERRDAGDTLPPVFSLFPLHPRTGLDPEYMDELSRVSRVYDECFRGGRPAGIKFQDDEMLLLAFGERRARAARWANWAFEEERKRVGESFDIEGIDGRQGPCIVAAEMAGILSEWHGDTPQGHAAAVCSSALRSAFWLWLEDDDRSLAAMRVLLEQCARLHVWAKKPEKAKKLESSAAATPKDWINAAGWKRLSALNRALGEFSHAHAKIRWDGARQILVDMQDDGTPHAIYTARAHTLDALIALLMHVCIGSAATLSSVMSESFGELAAEFHSDGRILEDELDKIFDRVLSLKNSSLGDYTFVGPARDLRETKDS
ncbi:hypothetical protein [Yinghuangia sp. YIM S09857]|uniref:hypothetical protein n=1 Tax=Yinghuangia sp. YIM S09857 TaxID=3436929 RepID=UPI003F5365CE